MRVKNENEEDRNITLEGQRHPNLRRQQNVALNSVQTYKEAINNASFYYKSLILNWF